MTERRHVRWLTPLLWLLVAVAAIVFLIHGPLHASSGYANDFAAPYTSARLWLQHRNPYDPAAFWTAWPAAGGPLTRPDGSPVYANPSSTHSVYPPPSIVMLAPCAMLSWSVAWGILIVLSTALYGAALLLLCRLLPGTWRRPCQPTFLMLGLLLAPVQSALHVSNVAALSAAVLLIAVYLLLSTTAGSHAIYARAPALGIAILLCVSLCLKPTLAPLVLLYLACRHRWAVLAITVSLATATTAAFQLLQPNWSWLPSLRANIDLLFTAGVADLAERNLTRSDRIDLQLPAYALTHSRSAAAILASVVTGVLLLLWYRAAKPLSNPAATAIFLDSNDPAPHLQQQARSRELLVLATLLVIGLLPFYQRYYSAIVLLLPLLWALANLGQPSSRRHARWTLGLCLVFVVNTSVLPRILGLHLPQSGLLHRLVEVFLVPHLCWLLCGLSLVLVDALRKTQTPQATN